MPSIPFAVRALIAALSLSCALPAIAAQNASPVYHDPVDLTDPAEQLSRYLRMLADDPHDLTSLVGAGHAALALGDAIAALGFYARAEEIAPKNGQVKAGLGSALVQMEQPKEALKLFAEAVSLGVPEADIASDRGLARDLRGDNRKAQADYALALRAAPDPETTRRLALSMAIGGDRAAALATLQPLIARGDKGASRASAFVLALTGDLKEAERAAAAEMTPSQVAALAPFLAQLPDLKSQQKAAAVYLGQFPSSGGKYSEAELFADASGKAQGTSLGSTSAARADDGLIPKGTPRGGDSDTDGDEPIFASAPPSGSGTRRRPGEGVGMVRATAKRTPNDAIATLVNPWSVPVPSPAEAPVLRPGAIGSGGAAVRVAPPAPKAMVKVAAAVEKRSVGPDATLKAKAEAASRTAKAEAAAKAKAQAKADAKAKAAAPERYWVQVASGKRKADFGKVWSGLVAKAPKQLSGRATWTAPWHASNRLLVGPFKSEGEAQDFVNALGKAGLSGIQFTTREGTQVEKLPLK